MKQLLFYQLKQNVIRDFFKIYFHGEKDEKVLLSIEIFFNTCASVFKINNSFATENDKISHFENFNHASHLNTENVTLS